jgi:hypothetical protein
MDTSNLRETFKRSTSPALLNNVASYHSFCCAIFVSVCLVSWFDKFTVKVNHCNVTEGFELVVSYDGTSRYR